MTLPQATPLTPPKPTVVVIGAGPAGLTAGYLLAQQGCQVTVIESDPVEVGGISRTVNYKGFLFDIGGHRFFSKSKEVNALWREILPDDFLSRPRMSRIYYAGKFYSYPLRAFEALMNLGIWQSTACVLSYMKAKIRPHPSPGSFHEWVANQFGERLFQIFFKTYTEKVWGMSCDDIAADWAAQRIKGLNLGTAILAGVRRSLGWKNRTPSSGVIKTLIDEFDYPRQGPGQMWKAAAQKMQDNGGTLLMGTTALELRQTEGNQGYSLIVKNASGDRQELKADHVISSMPLRELVTGLTDCPDVAKAANALRYRDFLTVALILQKPDPFPDNWIYIHEPAVKVGRIQNFRSWSPHMIPETGKSCLGLEYFCFEGDGLWTSSDADLIKLATKELVEIGLATSTDVVDGTVVRQPKAYPVYDEHYRQHVSKIKKYLEEKHPNLHVVGRNGMHKYNNQDHAMMTAMLTVRNILAGERLYNVWSVNEDAEYHEEGEKDAQAALSSERLVPQKKQAA